MSDAQTLLYGLDETKINKNARGLRQGLIDLSRARAKCVGKPHCALASALTVRTLFYFLETGTHYFRATGRRRDTVSTVKPGI